MIWGTPGSSFGKHHLVLWLGANLTGSKEKFCLISTSKVKFIGLTWFWLAYTVILGLSPIIVPCTYLSDVWGHCTVLVSTDTNHFGVPLILARHQQDIGCCWGDNPRVDHLSGDGFSPEQYVNVYSLCVCVPLCVCVCVICVYICICVCVCVCYIYLYMYLKLYFYLNILYHMILYYIILCYVIIYYVIPYIISYHFILFYFILVYCIYFIYIYIYIYVIYVYIVLVQWG